MGAYYTGKYKDDAAAHRGWIVGTFMEDTPRKTGLMEVKCWEIAAGSTEHLPKISSTLECTFILSGKTEAIVGGTPLTLAGGDYVVIEPGTPNNLHHNVLEPTTGLTIKAPSDPSAKQILETA